MSAIDLLPPLRAVIAEHGLTARKALGQNFLLDLNLTRRIARAAGPLSLGTVIEVGPGPGGLTRALLLEGAAAVLAVEADLRLDAALQSLCDAAEGRLHVVFGDALREDIPALLAERGLPGPYRICANLPYHVGTALLIAWLRVQPWPPWWESLTLMFQKEVAQRIVARPGSDAYGRLSVLAQWRSTARLLFDVHPSAFTPPPKVTSAIVQITPLPQPLFPCRLEALERVTAAAFGQRRKMLRASLRTLHPTPETLLAQAGLDPTARAETIDLEGFAALARALDTIA